MAKVKVDEIVEHLNLEFAKALKETIKEHLPNANFNTKELFKTFVKQIYGNCSEWENVPDDCVELDD